MKRAPILAIWKRMLMVWIVPWIVYSFLLLGGYIPLWSGLFLPFMVAFVYSRYTYSSFTVPKSSLMVIYMFSLYLGLTKYLISYGISRIMLPLYPVVVILVILLLGYRGIRSWLSYMGTTERALGASTYALGILYGLWVYFLLFYNIVSFRFLMIVFVAYALFIYGIYLLQWSGKALQLRLENISFHPGTYLGTIGNPLTFNLNLLLASLIGTIGLYNLVSNRLIVWLFSLVTMMLTVYNTKRSVIVGAIAYLILLPMLIIKDIYFSMWLVLIYYLVLIGIVYWFMISDHPLPRRIRAALFAIVFSRRLDRSNIHPQIKYFAISTATTRFWLVISGIRTWLKSPLWGFGFEYVRRYLMEHRAVQTYYAEHTKGYDRSHNMYVDVLIEGGVIWFLSLLVINIPIIYSLWKFPAAFLMCVVIAIILLFLFWDIVFIMSYGYIIGWAYYFVKSPVLSIPFTVVVIVDTFMFLTAILALFRHISDMYKGYARSLVTSDLELAREQVDVALAICPYQDHHIVWRIEIIVKLIQLLESRKSSPVYAGKLASSIIEYENHIKITNYPDVFMAYVGYAYGVLHRLGCEECLEKAIFFFTNALKLNSFNESVVMSYANFLGNIGRWDSTCEVLESFIFSKYTSDPLGFVENMKQVFLEYQRNYLKYVYHKDIDEKFDIDSHLKNRIAWQAGRISPNIIKMYIFCLIETRRFTDAKLWLHFYEKMYKDADPAFIDEMFLKIKLSQLRNL